MDKITIWHGDVGHVEFKQPPRLTLEQQKKFVDFFKKNYWVVDTKQVSVFRTKRMGDGQINMPWTEEEDAVLLDLSLRNCDIAEKLGRSFMSIVFRRSGMIGDILIFAEQEGIDLFDKNIDTVALVKRYRDETKKKKKDAKNIERRQKKEYEENKKKLDTLNKTRSEYGFLKKSFPTIFRQEEYDKTLQEISITKKKIRDYEDRTKSMEDNQDG